MSITKKELAQKLFDIKEEYSGKTNLDPKEVRKEMAEKEAQAIFDFVIGKTTTVTGTSATGGPVTGTGVIKP